MVLGNYPNIWGSYSWRRSQLQTAHWEMRRVSAWVAFMLIQDLLKLRKQAAERVFVKSRSHQHFDRKVFSLWSEGGGRSQEAANRRRLLFWRLWEVPGAAAVAEPFPSEPLPLQGAKFSIEVGRNWTPWANRAKFFLSRIVWCDISISARFCCYPREGKCRWTAFVTLTYSSKAIWKLSQFKSSKVVKEALLEIFYKSKYASEKWVNNFEHILLAALSFDLSPWLLEHSECFKCCSSG